jgi:DNA-binding MarR family transcriptional regulator
LSNTNLAECSCLALRQAARHVSQFYDHCLAPTGLRTTQYSILARLRRHGPMTINSLATDLVMDRTTLGRNILPLERDGLIAIVKGAADRRQKELHLTDLGAARLRTARPRWTAAQTTFETAFGGARTAQLRTLLGAVVTSEFSPAETGEPTERLIPVGQPAATPDPIDTLVPVGNAGQMIAAVDLDG